MRSSALWSIILVILIGFIGTAMPYPIFAPLFLGGSSGIARSGLLSPILLYSLLMAIYPLGTMIGSIYLGRISDRIGRKRVILGSLVIAVGTNLLSGYAIVIENYAVLFVARFLTGFCEGNISVARAVLTDLELKAADKAVAFGYLSSAGYAAYLVGPLLGGYLAYLDFSAPFFLAAALSVVAAVACRAYLPETRPGVVATASRSTVPIWKEPGLAVFLGIQFLITLTINVYHEFFPALMVSSWAATPAQISYATIVATTTMITLSVFGMRPILRRWDTGRLYPFSMVLLGASVALFMLPEHLLEVYPVFIAFGVSLAIFNSSSNAWFSDTYAHTGQGRLMGVIGSMFFLSNIVAAVVGGVIAGYSMTALLTAASAIAILSGLAFTVATRSRAARRRG